MAPRYGPSGIYAETANRLRENKRHSSSVIWRKLVLMKSTCHIVYNNIYYIFYVRIIGRKILRNQYYPINAFVGSQWYII